MPTPPGVMTSLARCRIKMPLLAHWLTFLHNLRSPLCMIAGQTALQETRDASHLVLLRLVFANVLEDSSAYAVVVNVTS
jgi:hypothetical protein